MIYKIEVKETKYYEIIVKADNIDAAFKKAEKKNGVINKDGIIRAKSMELIEESNLTF